MPVPAVKSMVTTLAQLQHHVRLAYGNSMQSQGQSNWSEPVVTGIGQGNGVGPQIWVAVSMPLFKILCQDGFIATVICTLTLQQRQLGGFIFVNDTNLIVTDTSNNVQKVATKMQQSLMLWHSLLKATSVIWYLKSVSGM